MLTDERLAAMPDATFKPHHPTATAMAPETRHPRAPARTPAFSLLALFALALCCPNADAHPVSQGAIEVQIDANQIRVHATVSPEEVIIASNATGAPAPPFAQAIQTHGAYLLSHMQVTANGQSLQGHLEPTPPPAHGRPTYDLVYPLNGAHPRVIRIHEDVLREIEFAPGNPWEAMFLVTVDHQDEPPAPGMLLSFRQPIDIDCSWTGNTVTAARTARSLQLLAFARHGIMHILTGYDHLLFIGALVLAIRGLWDLITVISAFTVAHTITLTLAALDIFRLSDSVVEPMIAASIVAIAVQNVFWPRQSHGWSRTLVAFLFGLFHGLGFAGGLLDAMSSMQGASAAAAIAAFSVGVEIGQQVVVLPVFGALWLLRRQTANAPRPVSLVQRYGSVAICLAGSVYFEAALRS
jgi:HupE / UreJ protein